MQFINRKIADPANCKLHLLLAFLPPHLYFAVQKDLFNFKYICHEELCKRVPDLLHLHGDQYLVHNFF